MMLSTSALPVRAASPVVHDLVEMLTLPKHWRAFGADRPTNFAVTAAIRLVMRIRKQRLPEPQFAAAGVGGAVSLGWRLADGKVVDCEIHGPRHIDWRCVIHGQSFEWTSAELEGFEWVC